MSSVLAAPPVPPELGTGVAALDGIDGLDVLHGPTWYPARDRWLLRCRITIRPGTEPRVPARTTWCVLVDQTYPVGRITIYPAAEGGITDTFHHQNRNTRARAGHPWRGGDICVHEGTRALGRLGGTTEPLDAAHRLAWRLTRAVAWVQAAAAGTLIGPGDPFELPDFDAPLHDVFGFSEDAESFRLWNGGAPYTGTAELYTAPGPPQGPCRTVVRRYRSMAGESVYELRWGKAFEPLTRDATTLGVWVRLPGVPHLPPWKAPETWGELRECFAAEGTDLDELVMAVSSRIRATGQGWLLCGFPIPKRVGETDVELFWQALRLPTLASPKGELKGFRNTEVNRRRVDRLVSLRNDVALSWVRSENWHPMTRSARGRFSDALTTRRVLLIGAGAVGSVVAELLVRGGVQELTICDSDTTLAGNLVRHMLTLKDVGREKAAALADRLNDASPHARVTVLRGAFPPSRPDDVRSAERAEIVIDCTGQDEIAFAMAAFHWREATTFWSLALDWEARRSLSFVTRGAQFPADAFLGAVRARLGGDDRCGRDERELPRDGIGCWHPVMPARVDHVWTLASLAVTEFDHALRTGTRLDELIVFERDDAESSPVVRRVH